MPRFDSMTLWAKHEHLLDGLDEAVGVWVAFHDKTSPQSSHNDLHKRKVQHKIEGFVNAFWTDLLDAFPENCRQVKSYWHFYKSDAVLTLKHGPGGKIPFTGTQHNDKHWNTSTVRRLLFLFGQVAGLLEQRLALNPETSVKTQPFWTVTSHDPQKILFLGGNSLNTVGRDSGRRCLLVKGPCPQSSLLDAAMRGETNLLATGEPQRHHTEAEAYTHGVKRAHSLLWEHCSVSSTLHDLHTILTSPKAQPRLGRHGLGTKDFQPLLKHTLSNGDAFVKVHDAQRRSRPLLERLNTMGEEQENVPISHHFVPDMEQAPPDNPLHPVAGHFVQAQNAEDATFVGDLFRLLRDLQKPTKTV